MERLFRVLDRYDADEDVARPVLTRILAIGPSNVRALTRLGRIDLRLGDYVNAYALCSKALDLDPNDPHALLLFAALSTDWDERIHTYERILSAHPDVQDAKENLKRAKQFAPHGRPVLAWPPGQHPPDSEHQATQ